MANIQISDLLPVEADFEMVSLTNKELLVVSGGWSIMDDFWLQWITNWETERQFYA